MTIKEIREWQAWDAINPIGEKRSDLRNAIVACVIANANRGRNVPPFRIDDFMPKFGPPKQMSNEQIKNVLKGFVNGDSGKHSS